MRVPLALIGYAGLLAGLCPVRPLWTDEVLQLIGTRALAGSNLLDFIRNMPGQGPLGYLLQHYAIQLMGFSVISARIVSVLFAVAAAFVVVNLCRELRHPHTGLALLMWMALPLVLRYSVEARPYSQALFFSALATLSLLRLLRAPSGKYALLYGLAVLAGAYTLPYTFFPQVGFVGYVLAKQSYRSNRAAAYSALGLTLAAVLFLPWVVSAVGHWHNAVESTQLSLQLGPTFPLLLLREMSGGGYACSVPLLILAIPGCRSVLTDQPTRQFLLCGMAASLVMPLVFDGAFHYYFAIRQVLCVLIPLVVLVGYGAGWLLRQRPVLAVVALGAIVVGAALKDERYFTDRSDDWAPAARTLKNHLNTGYCLAMLPENTPAFYAFFEPSLNHLNCRDWKTARSLIFPVTTYSSAGELKTMKDAFDNLGFRPEATEVVGNTRFLLYASHRKF